MTLESATPRLSARQSAAATLIAGLPLDDGVLAALIYDRRYPSAQDPIVLADLFPGRDAAEVADAARRAAALVRDARGYAARLLTRSATAPDLVATMAADHPGFSAKSYGDVLFLGVQAA